MSLEAAAAPYVSQLADIVINSLSSDVVYASVGPVLLSVNPGRVVPAPPLPTSTSLSHLHDGSALIPALTSQTGVPSATESQSGEDASVSLFDTSVIWRYHRELLQSKSRAGASDSLASAAADLVACQALPPHIFSTTASACSAAVREGPQSLAFVGERGAGKSEGARQAVRYITTVSRAVRTQQYEAALAAQQAASSRASRAYVGGSSSSSAAQLPAPGPGDPPRPRSLDALQSAADAVAASLTGAAAAPAAGRPASSSSAAPVPQLSPGLEQVLLDAQTALDAFSCAGDGFNRSAASSRAARLLSLQLDADGVVCAARIESHLIDHWRLACPPAAAAALHAHTAVAHGHSHGHSHSAAQHTDPLAVETNFRIFYLLLAGLEEVDRKTLHLLDNPGDYRYLQAYGPRACPSLRKDRLAAALGGVNTAAVDAVVSQSAVKAYVLTPNTGAGAAAPAAAAAATASASAAPSAAPVPSFLNPTVLTAQCAALRAALFRLQLSATAQHSIFRLLSACLLLGNLQFAQESAAPAAAAAAAAASKQPARTIVANTEVLASVAHLMGISAEELGMALTHAPVASPTATGGGSKPSLLQLPLALSRCCLLRDALACVIYRRLWNHLCSHINTVLSEQAVLLASSRQLMRPVTATATVTAPPPHTGEVHIFDGFGFSGGLGDGLEHLQNRSGGYTYTATGGRMLAGVASKRQAPTVGGPGGLAALLGNYASERLESVYQADALHREARALMDECAPHPYVASLAEAQREAASESSGSTSSSGSGSGGGGGGGSGGRSGSPARSHVPHSVRYRRQVPPIPLPDASRILSGFDTGGLHPGVFGQLREVSRYALPDPACGLLGNLAASIAVALPTTAASAGSASASASAVAGAWQPNAVCPAHWRLSHHDDSFLAAVAARLGPATAAAAVAAASPAQVAATAASTAALAGLAHKASPAEVHAALGIADADHAPAPVSAAAAAASASSAYLQGAKTAQQQHQQQQQQQQQQSALQSVQHSAHQLHAAMLVLEHPQGAVGYAVDGLIACAATCAGCECGSSSGGGPVPAAGGLPRHVYAAVAGGTTDPLLKVLLQKAPAAASPWPAMAPHACSSCVECLRSYLDAVTATLTASKVHWVRCVRTADEPCAPPDAISHDAIERQLRTGGLLQLGLLRAYAHPIRFASAEFFERYCGLDKEVLAAYTPLLASHQPARYAEAAQSLADALWTRLYLPYVNRRGLPAALGALDSAGAGAVQPLHVAVARLFRHQAATAAAPPPAPVSPVALALLGPPPLDRSRVSSDGSSAVSGGAGAGAGAGGGGVGAWSASGGTGAINGYGMGPVFVGRSTVFLSPEFLLFLESARGRAARGLDAAATRIAAAWRSNRAVQRFVKVRQAVIILQAHARAARISKAFAYYRQQGRIIKRFVAAKLQRLRWLRMRSAARMFQRAWQRRRIRTQCRLLHARVRALHHFMRGFIVVTATRRLHNAALRIQRPTRRYLTVRGRERMRRHGALAMQRLWRGHRTRRTYANAAAYLKVLHMALAKRRFFKLCAAKWKAIRTRRHYVALRQSAALCQRWIRSQLARWAFLRAKLAAIRIQANTRRLLARKAVAGLRSALATEREAAVVAALRKAEAKALGVGGSLLPPSAAAAAAAAAPHATGHSSSGDIRLLDVDVTSSAIGPAYCTERLVDASYLLSSATATTGSLLGGGSEIGNVVFPGLHASRHTDVDSILGDGDDAMSVMSADTQTLFGQQGDGEGSGGGGPGGFRARNPGFVWRKHTWSAAFRYCLTQLQQRGASLASVAVGSLHTAVAGSDGSVWTFGIGSLGTLGHGDTQSSALPRQMLTLVDPEHPGHPHASALEAQLEAAQAAEERQRWLGSGPGGRKANAREVGSAAVPGIRHPSSSQGATSPGSVASTAVYDLGAAPAPAAAARPNPLLRSLRPEPVAITHLVAGAQHTLALSPAGVAYAWGANDRGQCSLGHFDAVAYPCVVQGISQRVVHIAAGDAHSAFLTLQGTLYTCGAGTATGHGVPRLSEASERQEAAQAGNDGSPQSVRSRGGVGSSAASVTAPTVTPPDLEVASPLRVFGTVPVVDVACGRFHTVAVCASGDAFVWGLDTAGQCGQGARQQHDSAAAPAAATAADSAPTVYTTPQPLIVPGYGTAASSGGDGPLSPGAGKARAPRFARAACGAEHTLVLSASGRLYACGRNSHGQCGVGDRMDRSSLTVVQFPTPRRSGTGSAPAAASASSRLPASVAAAAGKRDTPVVLDIAAAGACSLAVVAPSAAAVTPTAGPGSLPSALVQPRVAVGAALQAQAQAGPPRLTLTAGQAAAGRQVYQWGRAGAVTEARVRLEIRHKLRKQADAVAAGFASAGGEDGGSVDGAGEAGEEEPEGEEQLQLPLGLDPVELLRPAPMRSAASLAAAGPASSASASPAPLAPLPVCVMASGHTNLTACLVATATPSIFSRASATSATASASAAAAAPASNMAPAHGTASAPRSRSSSIAESTYGGGGGGGYGYGWPHTGAASKVLAGAAKQLSKGPVRR